MKLAQHPFRVATLALFATVFVYILLTWGTATAQAGSAWQAGEGTAPGMPVELRREAERSWKVFQSQRRLAGTEKACSPRARYNWIHYQNAAKVILWSYYQQIYFCYTGKVVTYFYRVRWHKLGDVLPGPIDWKPWAFKGHVGNSCEGEACFIRGYRSTKRMAMTQGSFEVCAIKFAVCNHSTPTLTITAYGDGSVVGSAVN